MRVAILGRTHWLLDTADALTKFGHKIGLVGTCDNENDAAFRNLAQRHAAPFFNNPYLNKMASLLADTACDVAISLNWLKVLSGEVLAQFQHGILNGHCGDLPRYRGNACPNWAILNGESHIGLCVHRMVEKLDAGPIFVRELMQVTDETYINDVYDWMTAKLPSMFVRAMAMVEAGEQPSAQDQSLALRCYPRRPQDGLIDWRQSAKHIHRLIRASSRPLHGAYSTIEGHDRITIWRAHPVEAPSEYLAVPGQICFSKNGNPVVATGDGLLMLTEWSAKGVSVPSHARLL